MGNWVLGIALVATAVAAGVFALRAQIALALPERAAPRQMQTDLIAGLPDGLHVALCGAADRRFPIRSAAPPARP